MAAESGSKTYAKPKANSTYIPALDGLRAIAFFCVFGAHTNPHDFLGRMVPATFGVTLFFFLSGFLITTLLRGEAQKTGTIALKDFYIRRALRILIPMYITFAIEEVMGKLRFHDWRLSWSGFYSVLFYVYNYTRMTVHPEPILPRGFDLTWSLGVEEHFYLLFPLMYLIMLSKGLKRETQVKVLLGLCAIGLCWRTYVSYHDFPQSWTYYATDCRFDSILLGSLLALWTNPVFDAAPAFLQRYGGLSAGIAFVVLIGTMVLHGVPGVNAAEYLRYQDTLRYSLQGVCLYFLFHFAISSTGHWSVRWLEFKPLRYVGWLSYSLYLIHVAIQRQFDDVITNKWLVSPVVFALSFAYAYAMRHTVELPLQRLRARYRHAPAPVSKAVPVEGI